MTETQRKFLTEYLGECWKGDIIDGICERCGTIFSTNRSFTAAQDKQDLLKAVIEKGEWIEFEIQAMFLCPFKMTDYTQWLIQLSPIETAELICRWKGVE
jgi:uncharacterized OB-fold protein